MEIEEKIIQLSEDVKDWIGRSFHIIAGILTPLSIYAVPFLNRCIWLIPSLSFILFMMYEYTQWEHKGDDPCQEVLEYGMGFFSAVLSLIVLRIIVYLGLI